MKLFPLATNQTELHLDSGAVILFSYSTPVAAFVPQRGWLSIAEPQSGTTKRHIKAWLEGKTPELVSKITLEALLK